MDTASPGSQGRISQLAFACTYLSTALDMLKKPARHCRHGNFKSENLSKRELPRPLDQGKQQKMRSAVSVAGALT
jgi:hypothetical protein